MIALRANGRTPISLSLLCSDVNNSCCLSEISSLSPPLYCTRLSQNKGEETSFVELGGSWSQTGKDFVNIFKDFAFAISVSGNGRRIVIGTRPGGRNGLNRSDVRVFEKSENDWVQVGRVFYTLDDKNYEIAVSISEDGTIIAVGEPGYDDMISDKKNVGRVLTFKHDGDDWTQLGDDGDIIGSETDDFMGDALSLSSDGSSIVVGARRADRNGLVKNGYVSIYTLTGSSWSQVGHAIYGANNYMFVGYSVDISSGGRIVAIGCERCGTVRIIEVKDSKLVQLGSDIPGKVSGDRFGCSVSLSSESTWLRLEHLVRSIIRML